jgi:hypothetical protein
MENFNAVYESLRGDLEARTPDDPAISLVDNDRVLLDGSCAVGGSVAMALQKTACKRDLLSCRTILPNPLFQQGQEFFPEEGEEEGEGGAARDTMELTTPLLSNILRETRREVEREGEGSGTDPPSQVTGTGLNVFVQSHGTGMLNYGPIDLHPTLNIGRLLNPADSAGAVSCDQSPRPVLEAGMQNFPTAVRSCDQSPHSLPEAKAGTRNSPAAVCDQSPHPLPEAGMKDCLSLSSCLELCRNHLSFSESEAEHARDLYQRIEVAGEEGVEEVWLEASCHDSTQTSGRSHQEYIEAFVNFEMVSSKTRYT